MWGTPQQDRVGVGDSPAAGVAGTRGGRWATPWTVPHLQDSPTPPQTTLWGAARPLTLGRWWGAHPAPNGGAASHVGSQGAPRAGGEGLPSPLGPLAQALPSALTQELLCLPTRGGGVQSHCTPQPAWDCTATPHPGTGVRRGGACQRPPSSPPPLPPARTPHPCSDDSPPPLGSAAPPRPGHSPREKPYVKWC